MKNLIYYIIGLGVLIGLAALISGGGNDQSRGAYSASALTALEEHFDFGSISMQDGEVTHNFELLNTGNEPVIIQKIYTSCMCTTAKINDKKFGMPGHGLPSKTNIEIKGGESIELEAVFDPAAHGPSGVGLADRSIYIETNSARVPKLELSFQAIVTR